MESSNSERSYEDRVSDRCSDSEHHAEEVKESKKFHVARENLSEPSRKPICVCMHDLSELNTIQEQDIVAPDGSIIGITNRVRAGLEHFENPEAIDTRSQDKGRVIVYLTSFRGVRSTFEECRYVKTVLHNLRVKVEERDIYMNKHFYKEMDDRLEEYGVSKLAVPQVFISGQHIGGKEEVEELNETGELRRLLRNFEHQETGKNCGYCGGYNFIPCRKCGGSKDGIKNSFTKEFKALRCTHCNENGLEPCFECGKSGGGGGNLWNKELKKWKEREEYERREEKERRDKKKEQIKREALVGKFHKKLKEIEMAERQRIKEEGPKLTKEDSAADKISGDIKIELEKERQ